jgi:beta-carotene hydroxylase
VFQARIYFWALRNPRGRRAWIVGEGIGVIAMLLGAVAALSWTILPICYVALMIAGSWIIPLITSYLQHDASAPDKLHQTRAFRGLLARIVALDHLYHLEHHLYPAVPHQNWVRLARRLDPWLSAEGIHPVRFGL